MTDLTREQLQSVLADVCPHCKASLVVEYRPETQEWVHRPQGPHSITLCLATNLRNKYKDVLNG